LTKQFEEIVEGTATSLAERFGKGTARGEFTVVIPHTKAQGEAEGEDE
jgi:16S rRNA C1402 (ribose-2'-O) methylase RsmI